MGSDQFKNLIDSRAAAEVLGIKYDAFRARVSRGLIPESAQVRIGTALLFKRDRIERIAAAEMDDIVDRSNRVMHVVRGNPSGTYEKGSKK